MLLLVLFIAGKVLLPYLNQKSEMKFPFKRRGIILSGVIDSGQCFLSGRTPVGLSKDWIIRVFHKKDGFLVFL